MPYSRRTGRRYAAGSQSPYGGFESKVCILCGGKIVKAHPVSLRFHYDHATGTATSWHVEPCERLHGWPQGLADA